MAGRKPIFDREEQRKNQVVVPMSEQEKKRVQDAASAEDGSNEFRVAFYEPFKEFNTMWDELMKL